jgi:hypothetical protein
MEKEEEYFTGPFIRAQLNTTGNKQDTYYAVLNEKPVFVKGPFENIKQASVYNNVTFIKSILDSSTPCISSSIKKLVVDPDFLDTKLGSRKKFSENSPGFFIIFDDLIRETFDEKLPTITRTSKLWTEEVNVVDFSKVEKVKHLYYSPVWESSFYKKSPEIALQVIKHFILSWLIGTSADFALRNFLIKNGVCYHVDFEKVFCFDWKMQQTSLCSPRTKVLKFTIKFITSVWENELDGFIKTVKKNAHNLKKIVPEEIYGIINTRIESIQTLEGLIEIMNERATKKRARVE